MSGRGTHRNAQTVVVTRRVPAYSTCSLAPPPAEWGRGTHLPLRLQSGGGAPICGARNCDVAVWRMLMAHSIQHSSDHRDYGSFTITITSNQG